MMQQICTIFILTLTWQSIACMREIKMNPIQMEEREITEDTKSSDMDKNIEPISQTLANISKISSNSEKDVDESSGWSDTDRWLKCVLL